MALYCCGCNCGSTEQLLRNFLHRCGYPDWLSIPIAIGKEKSMRLIERIAPCPEMGMLRSYLRDLGKWAVIIGQNERGCRWSDITHNVPNSTIEAEHIVETFSDLPINHK